jgi:palmitoyltransferase
MLRACSRLVFAVFKHVERFSERATGAAGPVFVVLAAILLACCTFTFCISFFFSFFLSEARSDNKYSTVEAVFAYRFLSPDSSGLLAILAAAWSIYIVACFTFHYYMAMKVSPGSPLDDLAWFDSLPPIPKYLSRWSPAPRPRPEIILDYSSARIGGVAVSHDVHKSRRDAYGVKECKKCPGLPPKPERAHHCRVCGRCWLKFDHQYALAFSVLEYSKC